jgi:hypothetical protein
LISCIYLLVKADKNLVWNWSLLESRILRSNLIQDILAPALLRHFGKSTEGAGAHDRLLGADHLSDVVFVDQSPIGKTARSNPASYVGAWDAVREIFANSAMSRQRSYTASKFSFNGGDGRSLSTSISVAITGLVIACPDICECPINTINLTSFSESKVLSSNTQEPSDCVANLL